ncbi:hypothetical protein [Fodinicola acaciae]|uniref:hypothetical protein n=1 Tax=Fodinicola acaciae TaxID=2681555 RepID=UPI0013D344D2|nr:hypothetical protein [Fodinicola acaciae]
MDDKYVQQLRAKLAPDTVIATLIRASCFLSAYELIKSEVLEKVHDFFLCGFEGDTFLYDEASYQRAVASRDKNPFKASCAWLVEMQGLTVEQVATLEDVRQHRNEIAHELPKLLTDPDFEVRFDLLLAAAECVRVLGVFWGSIEVQTDPDIAMEDVDFEGIKSGPYLLMEYLILIASTAGEKTPEPEGKEPAG